MKRRFKSTIPQAVLVISILMVFVGHFSLLLFFGKEFNRDLFIFIVSSLSITGVYWCSSFLVINLIGLFLERKKNLFLFGLCWLLYLIGSSFFAFELISYQKLGLSLSEAFFLLLESFFSKGVLYRQIHFEVTKWFLIFGLFVAFLLLVHRKRQSIFWGTLRSIAIPMLPMLVLLILCSICLIFENRICPNIASQRACETLGRAPYHRSYPQPALIRWKNVEIKSKFSKKVQEGLFDEVRQKKKLKKPNLFFVIIDSLATYGVKSEITPNLLKHFKPEYRFSAIAPSNCTHSSWYPIFAGDQSYFWKNHMIQPQDEGVLPIRLLREMGYRIHLITSQSLEPLKKRQKIFGGSPRHLASLVGPDELDGGTESKYALSARAIRKLMEIRKQSDQQEGGNLYVLALFATHWPYALGEGFSPRVKPYMENVSLEATVSPRRDQHLLLKNRYLNSLAFIDHTLGELFEELQLTGAWQDSGVFVFGDHGESFEPGKAMVHCSSLGSHEIVTPLFVKPPKSATTLNLADTSSPLISTQDVMPTVFELLGVSREKLDVFDGKSLFESGSNQKKFVVSLNGGKGTFWEVKIFDGECSGFFEFEGVKTQGRDLFVTEARLVKIEQSSGQLVFDDTNFREKMESYFNELIKDGINFGRIASESGRAKVF